MSVPGAVAQDVYRRCIARTPQGSRGTHAVTASRMLDDPEIITRITELKVALEDNAAFRFNLTRERWLQMFLNIAKKARKAGDYSAAKGCLREIGLAMPGWYTPVQVEVSADVHVTSWVQKIRQNLEQAKVIDCDTPSLPDGEVDFSCD